MAILFTPDVLNSLTFHMDVVSNDLQAAKKLSSANSDNNLCKYFLKGTCMRGSQCPYRHSRTVSDTVCKHWLRGLCKKETTCEYVHEYDLSRMPLCQFFQTYGTCGNPDCAFVHVRADESDLECTEYTKGFCKDGPYCRRKHQRREMCLDYLAGICFQGPLCEKAHPRWDMKKDASGNLPLDESKLKKGPVSISEITCHLCHLPGHFAAECPNASENERDREKARGRRNLTDVLCFRCGQKGHYANVCKNDRVPPPPGGYQIPGKRQQQQHH